MLFVRFSIFFYCDWTQMLKGAFKEPKFALLRVHKVLTWFIFPLLVESIYHIVLLFVNDLRLFSGWAADHPELIVLLNHIQRAFWALYIAIEILLFRNIFEYRTVYVHILSRMAITETLFMLESSQVHLATVVVDASFLANVIYFYIEHLWHIYNL